MIRRAVRRAVPSGRAFGVLRVSPAAPALALATLLAAALPLLSGCEAVSWVANGVAPPKVKAVYTLQEKPTLVLVDDPAQNIGDPTAPTRIADSIKHFVSTNTKVTFVNQQALLKYKDAHADFDRVPIEKVGRDLGAAQVIYVFVAQASIEREPGMLRPTAVVSVKVFDAESGRRVFPGETGMPEQSGVTTQGLPVTVTMRHKAANDESLDALMPALRAELADRIGKIVAQLFYDHLPRQPGEPIEDM